MVLAISVILSPVQTKNDEKKNETNSISANGEALLHSTRSDGSCSGKKNWSKYNIRIETERGREVCRGAQFVVVVQCNVMWRPTSLDGDWMSTHEHTKWLSRSQCKRMEKRTTNPTANGDNTNRVGIWTMGMGRNAFFFIRHYIQRVACAMCDEIEKEGERAGGTLLIFRCPFFSHFVHKYSFWYFADSL